MIKGLYLFLVLVLYLPNKAASLLYNFRKITLILIRFQVSQELQEHSAGFKFLAGLREWPLAKYGQIVVNLVQKVSGGISWLSCLAV